MQVRAEVAVRVELLVSLHLLLQPDVLLHQLLVPALALFEVVELGRSAQVGLRDVGALVRLAIEYTHITR